MPIWFIEPHSHLKARFIIGGLDKINYCDPHLGYSPTKGPQCFPVTPIGEKLTKDKFRELLNAHKELLVWEHVSTIPTPQGQRDIYLWEYKTYTAAGYHIQNGVPCALGHTLRYAQGKGNCVECSRNKPKREAPYSGITDLFSKSARADAREAGLSTYIGKPCKACSGVFKYVSSGNCTQCARARQRKNLQNPFGL